MTPEAGALDRTPQPWSPLRVSIRVALAVLITAAVAVGGILLAAPFLIAALHGYISIEELYLAGCVSIAAAYIVAARLLDRDWRGVLGLRTFVVGRVFAALVAAIFVIFVLETIFLNLFPESGEAGINLPDNPVERTLVIISVVLGFPIMEEILFRGHLHHRLRAILTAAPTLAITSALFTVFHFDRSFVSMLLVFPTGVLLGYARERLGSTVPCILLHMMFNAGAVATEFLRL